MSERRPARQADPLVPSKADPPASASIGAMTGEENYIENELHAGEGLTGLRLEQLGFEPRMEDLAEDQLNRLGADDLNG